VIELLTNEVQHYSWGSTSAIPELLGRAPDGRPWAELWIGAHPRAPSRIGGEPLDVRIAREPSVLGDRSIASHGARLPFLLKVLAAAEPLSIQCHPDAAQAEAGFAREEAARIPIDAPNRSYRDRSHKPELIVAMTRFRALRGFRDPAEVTALLAAVGLEALAPSDGLGPFFQRLMGLSRDQHRALIAAAVARAGSGDERHAAMLELCRRYPDDPGALAPLFLNLVTLEPGDGMFLPARELHSYLDGVAVEIMASSDNVLRGGLTPKHVDVPELIRVLDFVPRRPEVLTPTAIGGERTYVTPASEFIFSSISVRGVWEPPSREGVEILLCTEGQMSAGGIVLSRGQTVLVPHGEAYTLLGRGHVFRARCY
jgi:mannose-6-phosphate isomerase